MKGFCRVPVRSLDRRNWRTEFAIPPPDPQVAFSVADNTLFLGALRPFPKKENFYWSRQFLLQFPTKRSAGGPGAGL